MTSQFVNIQWRERPVRIEYAWINPSDRPTPMIVFLHEGLGSLAMWKNFPQRLCDALQCQGLVYSRPGYGRSTPRAIDDSLGIDFMHRQAFEALPALLAQLNLSLPIWLLGHSDGASIALLYASRHAQNVAGVIAVAPHIFVEDVTVRSIEQARHAYESTQLRQRLAPYHDDVDSTFWGWNQVWLSPEFKQWRMTEELTSVTCPLLAVQGIDDEYGTLSQIRDIRKYAPQTQLLEIPECGHSPHRDQADKLIASVTDFVLQHAAPRHSFQ